MTLSYKLRENILLINCDYCFTRKDTIECFKDAIRDPFFKKGMSVLIDASNYEIVLPYHAVKSILAFLSNQSDTFGPRFAFVEKSLSPFRVGRIFSVLAKDYGLECKSFAKHEDAREWLVEMSAYQIHPLTHQSNRPDSLKN
jgi:hypothetical protein